MLFFSLFLICGAVPCCKSPFHCYLLFGVSSFFLHLSIQKLDITCPFHSLIIFATFGSVDFQFHSLKSNGNQKTAEPNPRTEKRPIHIDRTTEYSYLHALTSESLQIIYKYKFFQQNRNGAKSNIELRCLTIEH